MRRVDFTPNDNRAVTWMLAKELAKKNRGRNRILFSAVVICIVTLSSVFGIALGKVQAEYVRDIRQAGTVSSARLENASQSQYDAIRSLNYVKYAGRSVRIGSAGSSGESGGDTICSLSMLDTAAWESIQKPAYTEIQGHYPREKKEVMLPVRALESMGIAEPKIGMKIDLTVSAGLFRTEQEQFILCGWYTDYMDVAAHTAEGYLSEEKAREWGWKPEEGSDILICPADHMDWREVEQKLYQDVSRTDDGQTFEVSNSAAYDAVNKLTGSYEMAALGTVVVLCGMFFLIYNILQISMVGDIRQMGLLNTIGTTRKQLWKICHGQFCRYLLPGVIVGIILSVGMLCFFIPEILGQQYLNGYGGSGGVRIFRPGIVAAAALFALTIAEGAAAGMIHRTVNISCVESMHYTGIRRHKRTQKKKSAERRLEKSRKVGKKGAERELLFMARRNATRKMAHFLLTVCSLFLGMQIFLVSVVVIDGSDYRHVIEQRPEFLIAGEFAEWAKEEGYGLEYRTRDLGQDPMETQGGTIGLLSGNYYDEFTPISQTAKEALLGLNGVKEEESYVLEGAYAETATTEKGWQPLMDKEDWDHTFIEENIGQGEEDMRLIRGFEEDTIQILNDTELKKLETYVKEQQLAVDMESVKDGRGVLFLHDHQMSPEQEKIAEDSVGEPICFTMMRNKVEWDMWNTATLEEQKNLEFPLRKSEGLFISGYLDNRAEGFPHIRQTWHGSEGMTYFLVSEKGFEKIPTNRKTLYMELSVEEEREPQIKKEIQNILASENREREEAGETGMFCISKSDLKAEAADEIRGNRLILGCISAVLLVAGLANYLNVMVAGIFSRKQELDVMERIGMTKRQMRRMLLYEGLYYAGLVSCLILTVGSGILKIVKIYLEGKLSYFTFYYPTGWTAALLVILICICIGISIIIQLKGKA